MNIFMLNSLTILLFLLEEWVFWVWKWMENFQFDKRKEKKKHL